MLVYEIRMSLKVLNGVFTPIKGTLKRVQQGVTYYLAAFTQSDEGSNVTISDMPSDESGGETDTYSARIFVT